MFEGDGVVKDFPGNYTEYRQWRDNRDREDKEARAAQANAAAKVPATESDAPRVSRGGLERAPKLTFKERKEFESLTTEIDALTAEKAELEAIFNSGAEIPDIAEKSARYTEVSDLLDEKEMRWLELSEKE